ncbi:MAG: putative peptidoglycan O-acetyltransferase yrhL [Acidimicrobiales bacterium]|nr:putative peptidoglycan O-acetyltransferase yrhL [Acidimicrobiales bacterium]
MAVIDCPRGQSGPGGLPPAAGPPARSVRLPEIDAMRVIASLVVVLWHLTFSGWAMRDAAHGVRFVGLSEVVRYGYVMPEIFFVISGLVIMSAVQGTTPSAFLRGRVIRLVPLFWLLCTLTWLVSRNHPHFGPLSTRDYLLNMTFLTAPAGGPFIDAVYWTLTVEICFYATVWLAMCSGRLDRLRTLVGGWLVAGVVVELLARNATGLLEHAAFLMRWNSCFAAGIACWMLQRDRRDRFAWVTLAACAALMFRAVWLVAEEFGPHLRPGVTLNPWIGAVLVELGLALLVLLSLRGPTGWISERATRRWAVAGALTYPVYLFHENVGLVAMARFDWVNRWALLATLLAAVTAFAWLVTRFYETPVRTWLTHRLPG